jgi:ketosteroid isomerase-like protein
MALDNQRIVGQAYTIAEAMDMAGWVAAFTEDGTFTGESIGESIGVTWKGPAELRQQAENYHRAFPDMHPELLRSYVSGKVVAGTRLAQPAARGADGLLGIARRS